MLLHAFTACHATERQMLLLIDGAVSIKNLNHRSLQVHCIVVDKTEALADKVLSLLNAKLYAICLDSLIIGLDFFEATQNLLWHLRLGELAHSVEAVIA